jgi:starvation-inducible outer membrane lipoprotein
MYSTSHNILKQWRTKMTSGHNDVRWGGKMVDISNINNSKMQRIVIQYYKSAGQYQIAADAKVGLKMPDAARGLQAP